MPIPGSLGTPALAIYPGNPTNVSTRIFNVPLGTLVIDTSTPGVYQKTTALGDNSGYAGFAGSTLTGGVIANGFTASGSAANDFSGSTGAFKTSTGAATFGGSSNTFTNAITMGTASQGLVLKQGSNGLCGTFVCNGATPVTVSNTNVAVTDAIIVSLNTVGGTVGAVPAVKTITAATGFTIAGTASDTSTYNYAIIKNQA